MLFPSQKDLWYFSLRLVIISFWIFTNTSLLLFENKIPTIFSTTTLCKVSKMKSFECFDSQPQLLAKSSVLFKFIQFLVFPLRISLHFQKPLLVALSDVPLYHPCIDTQWKDGFSRVLLLFLLPFLVKISVIINFQFGSNSLRIFLRWTSMSDF